MIYLNRSLGTYSDYSMQQNESLLFIASFVRYNGFFWPLQDDHELFEDEPDEDEDPLPGSSFDG